MNGVRDEPDLCLETDELTLIPGMPEIYIQLQ